MHTMHSDELLPSGGKWACGLQQQIMFLIGSVLSSEETIA